MSRLRFITLPIALLACLLAYQNCSPPTALEQEQTNILGLQTTAISEEEVLASDPSAENVNPQVNGEEEQVTVTVIMRCLEVMDERRCECSEGFTYDKNTHSCVADSLIAEVIDSLVDPSHLLFGEQPTGVCSKDINKHGHPSTCLCEGSNDSYSSMTGLCTKNYMPMAMICTEDINEFGYSSHCSCAKHESYNQETGRCQVPKSMALPRGACSRDMNEYFQPSSCTCNLEEDMEYNSKTGYCYEY